MTNEYNVNNDENKQNDLVNEELLDQNINVETKAIDMQNSYYNKAAKKSLYLCLVSVAIFLIGYIKSGGSFSEADGGAVWWIFIPILLVVEPIIIISSVVLGIKGLKGNKRIPSYISLIINLVKIILIAVIMIK